MMKKTDSSILTATDEAKSVELKTDDPSVILATRQYVNETIHEAIQEARKQSDESYWKRDEQLFPERGEGHQTLPSGLILKWGYVQEPNPYGEVITYSTPFPNSVFGVFTTGADGENRAFEVFNVVLQGNDAFKLFVGFSGTRHSSPCFWLALGY